MNPLTTAQIPIASSSCRDGTADGPAHTRINACPKSTRTITQQKFSATVTFMVIQKVRRTQL